MLFWSPCPIVLKDLLIPLKLLPADVAGMSIQQHNWPVLGFDLASTSLDAEFLPRQSCSTGFRSSINISACIKGIMQQGEDSSTPQRFPHQLPFACSLPQPIRKTKLMGPEVFHHC